MVTRKVGSLLFTIVATFVSEYICIMFKWTAGRPLYGVELVLWLIDYTLLTVVYMGLPGPVKWRKKLPGAIAIFVLSYVLCWAFVPIVGFEAAFAFIVVNYTVWVILLDILFTWLGL
jgi:hypothetical protein